MRNKKNIYTNTILLLFIIFSICCAIFPTRIATTFNKKSNNVYYYGNRQTKNISLMFNVYENTDIVNSIIDVLDSYNVKCTFFVGGCWADDNSETLNKIVNNGHEIANHGYYHKDHAKISYNLNIEEIDNNSKVIYEQTGIKPTLFAPPSGSFNNTTVECVEELGYKLIMWSKDTIDWRDKDKNLVFYRATNNICGGDLILMHPKSHTLLALPEILEYYRSIYYNVVTVSENIVGL